MMTKMRLLGRDDGWMLEILSGRREGRKEGRKGDDDDEARG